MTFQIDVPFLLMSIIILAPVGTVFTKADALSIVKPLGTIKAGVKLVPVTSVPTIVKTKVGFIAASTSSKFTLISADLAIV